MIHRAYLGIGSNIEPEKHVRLGLDELATSFRLSRVSTVYRSAAAGFDGAPFLNCVVAIDTVMPLAALAAAIREIEFRYGRTLDCSKFSSRHLDIDILTFDDLSGVHDGIVLPREEISKSAYVLCPFAEIAGDLRLPEQHLTLARLWQQYDRACQPLEHVPFSWREMSLPILSRSALERPMTTGDQQRLRRSS